MAGHANLMQGVIFLHIIKGKCWLQHHVDFVTSAEKGRPTQSYHVYQLLPLMIVYIHENKDYPTHTVYFTNGDNVTVNYTVRVN